VNLDAGAPLPPRWGWYVILYFFLGGLAAGCYFIATMLDANDDPRDAEAVRLGYRIAFPLVLVCGILLVLDLGKPMRFWHMLVQSERLPLPLLKPWSPISVGSWVLTLFGFFSFVSFAGTLVHDGRIRWQPLVAADRWARSRSRPLSIAWAVVGAFFGFFLAGYTGVLLTAGANATWHGAKLLGGLFLASAASTSYALLLLLLLRRGRTHADITVARLAAADRWAVLIEIVVLTAMLVLLGRAARPFVSGGFGIVFWLGVVVVGLLVPLVLHWRPGLRGGVRAAPSVVESRLKLGAVCALVGGLLLRFVIVMSPQWPRVSLWHL
jgi:protein NrfD